MKCRFFAIALLVTTAFTARAQTPGTKLWSFTTGATITSDPAIADDGTIYVGSADKKLYAINPSGEKSWEFATQGAISIAPVIGPGGTIYIASDDNTLYAVGSDGKQRWEFPTGFPLVEPPAIGADGTIYFSSPNGNLYALNSNGSEKWRFNTGSSVPAPSVGVDGTIYVGSTVYLGARWSSLYALNADGSTKWRYDIGYYIPTATSPCAIAVDGTIYFMRDSTLNALSAAGTKLFDNVGAFDSRFAIGQGGILYGRSYFIGDYQARFSDGSLKWNRSLLSTPTLSTYPALAADGTIYVGSEGGMMYALDSSGTIQWAFATQSSIHSSPVIGTNGVVYFGADDGNLYAVNGSAGLAKTAWPMYRRDAKHTGAVTTPILSQTVLGLAMYPGITISGNVGSPYRIEVSTDPTTSTSWQFLATVTLDRTPFFFVDVNAGNSTKRFYRALALP